MVLFLPSLLKIAMGDEHSFENYIINLICGHSFATGIAISSVELIDLDIYSLTNKRQNQFIASELIQRAGFDVANLSKRSR